MFRERFSTPKQKATWQQQLFAIQQGTDTVDTYVNKFKQLKERVDPDNAFPPNFLVQLFIQGLKPEYAINVQAAEPANLAAAVTEARKWETGRLMINNSNSNTTDKAIEQLTEQIAKLSVNLLEKQAPPPKPIYYSDNSDKNKYRSDDRDLTCYYCGNLGHVARNCRIRQDDQKKEREKFSSRQNYRSDNRYHSDNRPNYRSNQSYDRSRSRERNRSRDNNYSRNYRPQSNDRNSRPTYRDRSNNYNRSQSRSQSRERHRDNNRRFSDRSHSRSSTPYPRDIYIADTVPDFTYEQFETFLNNTSIQAALTEYLMEENINITQTSNHTTPVRCNIKLQDQPYQAIIDSGASISMISYKVVKDLGLKIESPSTSLIVSAAGSSVRPLGIIKDLPIEIEGTTIPIDVEVIEATTYSVLLGNDWSQKVDATYNWKNKAYTLKWNNKKIHVTTTYNQDQPLPAQPTITNKDDLEQFEQEYLYPKEIYTIDTQEDSENNNDTNPWQIQGSRQRSNQTRNRPIKRCGTCSSPQHVFKDCSG